MNQLTSYQKNQSTKEKCTFFIPEIKLLLTADNMKFNVFHHKYLHRATLLWQSYQIKLDDKFCV